MLPEEYFSVKIQGVWMCSTSPVKLKANTEANARAKMLIYLIEHGPLLPNEALSKAQ